MGQATDPQTKLGKWVNGTINASAPPVRLAKSDGTELVIDSVSGAIAVIDWTHHEVHAGETYSVSALGSVSDDASIDITFTTNSTAEAHMTFFGSAGGDAEFYLFESPNTTGGSALTPRNMKRSSSDSSSVVVKSGPTVNSTGTALQSVFSAGGSGGNALGGSVRQGAEWVLKTSTVYLARGINRGGATKTMGMVAEWYEEDV